MGNECCAQSRDKVKKPKSDESNNVSMNVLERSQNQRIGIVDLGTSKYAQMKYYAAAINKKP